MRSCLTLILALTCGIGAARADTLADIKARDKIIVGVKNDYPPFGFLDKSGKIVGFEVDLARYVAEKLLGSPDKIELVPVVASNRIQFLQAGRIDLILATLGVTPERGKVIDFTLYYYMGGGAMLVAPKTSSLDSWEAARGHSICGIQGSYYNTTLGERFGIKLVNFTGLPDAYKALEDNRCDGIAFDQATLMKKLEDPVWKAGFKVAAEPYEVTPQAGGVRKDEKPFMDAVNKAMLQAEAEGRMVEWEKTYEMPNDPYVAAQVDIAKAKLAGQ